MSTIHPREQITRAARNELADLLLTWSDKHTLSLAEEISILSSEMSRSIENATKYLIREERHGDTETPGGLSQ